jgi:isoleucyl-tRNA synthetase
MIIVASEKTCAALKDVEEFFLELTNIKTIEYASKAPELVSQREWSSCTEDDIQVFLDTHRDESLLGEGLMRDIARRVQSLRKELGYTPTDVLEEVHISELDNQSVRLLEPYLMEMEELVRTKKVLLHGSRERIELKWHEHQLDDKKIYIAIP